MKLVILSDTHGQHDKLTIPKGDVLIHCGDVTQNGTKKELDSFLIWFNSLNFKYKILIAGNHDHYLESHKEYLNAYPNKLFFYLYNSSINIEGVKFWGSPYTPSYKQLAFNKNRGISIKSIWNKIPDDVDVIITHGPPAGVLDKTNNGLSVGCEALVDRIKYINPSYHFFGHIHESFGIKNINRTLFVNACMTDKNKQIVNSPIVLQLKNVRHATASMN